jgi:KRAB domain-containing zinc finger protein
MELAYASQTEDEGIKTEPDETSNGMDVSSESEPKCYVIISEKPLKLKKRKCFYILPKPSDSLDLVSLETHLIQEQLPKTDRLTPLSSNVDSEQNGPDVEDDDSMLKEVQCYFCSQVLLRIDIKAHMFKSHGRYCGQKFGAPRPFKCHVCNESLVKELKDTPGHVCFVNTTVKKKGEPYKCETCGFLCVKIRQLTRHIQSIHCEDRPFECSQCDYKAKLYVELDKHIRRVHDKEKNSVCGKCGDKFFDGSDLSSHKKKKHRSRLVITEWPCNTCEKMFESKRSLAAHRKFHLTDVKRTPTDRIPCETCGQVFANKYLLTYHIEWDHPTQDAIDQIECNCQKCNMVFPSATVLDVHLAECLDDPKNFPCEICIKIGNSDAARGSIDYKWKSGIALKKHLAEEHHSIRLVCNICGLILKTRNKALLEHHKQTMHEGLKNWTCELCGKTYASKAALENHVKINHENKRFKCKLCDKDLRSQISLRTHIAAVHEKTVEFKCQFCGHKTFSKCGLNSHINRVHKDSSAISYRYPCTICNKNYYKRKRLAEHMDKHHPKTNL